MTANTLIILEIWTLVLATWIDPARTQMPGARMPGARMPGFGANAAPNAQLVAAVKELIHPNAQPTQAMITISQRHRGVPSTVAQLLEYTPHFVVEAQKYDVRVPGVYGPPPVELLRSHLIAKGTEWMNKQNANNTGGAGGRWAGWNNWMAGQRPGGAAQRGAGGGRGGGASGGGAGGGGAGGGGAGGGGAGGGGMGQWSSFMGQWANMLGGAGGGGAGGGGAAGGGTAGEEAAPAAGAGKRRNGGRKGKGRRQGNNRPTSPPINFGDSSSPAPVGETTPIEEQIEV